MGSSGSGGEDFLSRLRKRGLRGVEFVVTDDHAGLEQAIAALLPEAIRQRCYVHFLVEALGGLENDPKFRLGKYGYTMRRMRGKGRSGFIASKKNRDSRGSDRVTAVLECPERLGGDRRVCGRSWMISLIHYRTRQDRESAFEQPLGHGLNEDGGVSAEDGPGMVNLRNYPGRSPLSGSGGRCCLTVW